MWLLYLLMRCRLDNLQQLPIKCRLVVSLPRELLTASECWKTVGNYALIKPAGVDYNFLFLWPLISVHFHSTPRVWVIHNMPFGLKEHSAYDYHIWQRSIRCCYAVQVQQFMATHLTYIKIIFMSSWLGTSIVCLFFLNYFSKHSAFKSII